MHPEVRHGCFIFITIATTLWLREPFVEALEVSLNSENAQHYSHILLVPFLSFYLLYLKRTDIFSKVQWSPWLGAALVTGASLVHGLAALPTTDQLDTLSPHILALVVMVWGGFLFCYGTRSARIASFGLGFLLLMVPIPSYLLSHIIGFLQQASAEASATIFSFLGVPVFRQGFTFALSNFTIEVAEECSGIRSALALFITSLVAGHLFLRSFWGKLIPVLIVIPLAIIKNAFRIVGLALLANYVDPRYITDSVLHRSGGIPLFLLSLCILFSIVWFSKKLESRLRPI
jgi:exosortase